jgi:dihydroorotase
VSSEDVLYKCGWSPLEGQQLHASVWMTILGGEIVYRDGKVAQKPRGQALVFS